MLAAATAMLLIAVMAVLAVRSCSSDADEPAATPFDPAHYARLGARDFAKLGKDPDAFKGKRFIIYGKVSYFDSTTGSDTFQAETGNARLTPGENGYLVGYSQIAFLKGTKRMLADVVKGDVFEAYVMVRGEYNYESTTGGSVPSIKMRVDKISVYATAK